MNTPRWNMSILEPSFSSAIEAFQAAKDKFIGKTVEIIDEHFNGQPWGHSKPKLKGTITTITAVHFDLHWGISFALKNDENWCYIGIDGVRFMSGSAEGRESMSFDREELKRLIVESLKYDLTNQDNPKIWLELRQALDYAEGAPKETK